MSPADPKRRARYVATAEEWSVILPYVSWLQGGKCGCGCNRRIESHHHLIPRGQGGDDVISNLVGLYGDGTRGCHGALTSANRVNDGRNFPSGKTRWITPDEVRRGIRRNLRPDQIQYITNREGAWYLDKHYPEGA